MSLKITLNAVLFFLVLAIASCSAPETTTSVEVVAPTAPQPAEAAPAVAAKAEPAKAEAVQPTTDTSEVIVALGDKKLTAQKLDWMQPNANNQQVIN